MRKDRIGIEITNQKGFLMFGDLSRQQRERGVNVSGNEVDVICDSCHHKYRFKKDVEKGRIGDGGKWRVFLRGNQVSKGDVDYYNKLRVEFYCTHCQDDLPPLSGY